MYKAVSKSIEDYFEPVLPVEGFEVLLSLSLSLLTRLAAISTALCLRRQNSVYKNSIRWHPDEIKVKDRELEKKEREEEENVGEKKEEKEFAWNRIYPTTESAPLWRNEAGGSSSFQDRPFPTKDASCFHRVSSKRHENGELVRKIRGSEDGSRDDLASLQGCWKFKRHGLFSPTLSELKLKNQAIQSGRSAKNIDLHHVFFSFCSIFYPLSFFILFFFFLFSRFPIKRKHRNVSVNVETRQRSIEREARKLKKNIIFAFVNRPYSRSMRFLCWTKIIINGISGVLIEACTGGGVLRGGKQNNNKKEKKERNTGKEGEKKIYESFAFLFAPGKNIKFQCTASQKRGIRRSRFCSLWTL